MSNFENQVRRWRNQLKRWWAAQSSGQSRSAQAQRPQHKMCPVCGKFNEKGASVCEYCDATLGEARRSAPRGGGSSPLNPISAIFGICGLIFVVSILLSQEEGRGFLMGPSSKAVIALGANHAELVWEGNEYWRWITYAYLHGGLMHILFNMMALGNLGPLILEGFGPRRFWLITCVTAIAAGAASAFGGLFGIGGFSVGFSGALFGYLGAGYILLSRHGHHALARRFKGYMIWGNLFFIVLSFLGVFPVDNLAHLGGMFAGLGLGRWCLSEDAMRHGRQPERLVLTGSVVLLAFGLFRAVQYVGALYGGG